MFNDSFKSRYTTIPFATFARNNATAEDFTPFLHNHREIELLIVTDGRGVLHAETQIYNIKKGDVVIIAPYLSHHIEAEKNCFFSHKCLCFDMSLIPDKELKSGLEKGSVSVFPLIKSKDKNSPALFSFIDKAFEAHATGENGWELDVIGNLCMIFALLKQHKYIKSGIFQRKEICRNMIEYIDKNYVFSVTSADAAKEFFISESYFCRLFKENFGQPFQKYLCMYRIEKSKNLLRTTDMSVSEIAAAVGFNSFSYFSKMFREFVSSTPLEYRKST